MTVPQEFFALLADETRLRCLLLLQREKEICVCEFSSILGSIQPKISRHLALLRQAGLLADERRGQWVYYSLNTRSDKWMHQVLKMTLEDLQYREPYRSDLEKLQALRSQDPCAKFSM